ncbi:drug resistance transporter, EmrB/QacA subfamily [Actinokineospora alba]|uniref:Drug resistance transporter, EmrB/QacA subfamily n=1 Tax=Actinokineospora alba TaxID=504798 RepID=A0A1H0W7U7_9PSEU|nr:MFS transporter [Actinokineospora alba]TDP69982.1 EmrB/QacA subfamily drug resistance transporter [Actinokineospora alba]SDJ50579.1 drug resistance transporter, EmrB/QacA subfamily [Actinokineospora alba]SDP86797.1 drug resistance transporter, EmrB/QacA subfamily [Actinokineospora alba]
MSRVHATVALIAFLAAADNTVVAAAAPSIAADLGLGVTATQGITVAYLLPFAALLLAAGAVVDRLGERVVLRAGLLAFAAGTVVAGAARSVEPLLAGRVTQGLAAALLVPATLSLLRTRLAPEARPRAAALWTIALALALAAGPALGGVVAQYAHWSWVFWGALPVVACCLAVLPPAGPTRARRTDAVGAGLAALTMLLLTAALLVFAEGGAAASALTIAAVLVAALFALRERTTAAPLLPPALLRLPVFRTALVVQLLWGLGVTGVCVVTPLAHQRILGLGPADAALPLVAVAVALIVTAPWVPRVLAALGPGATVASGLVLVAAGLIMVAVVNHVPLVWPRLPGLVLVGIGSAFTVPLTTLALDVAGDDQTGAASGLLSSTREFAGALGVAAVAVLMGGRVDAFAAGYTDALIAAAVLQLAAAALAVRLSRIHTVNRRSSRAADKKDDRISARLT